MYAGGVGRPRQRRPREVISCEETCGARSSASSKHVDTKIQFNDCFVQDR